MTLAPILDRSAHPIADRTPVSRFLVVIPTYNEADNVQRILRRVFEALPSAECLVVDDNSPDGTGEVVDRLALSEPRIRVLHREAKDGLGAAYLAGFRWALTSGYDAVVEMDADGSHAPEELPRLLAALDYCDVVLGSRWVPGGVVIDWPKSRELLSRAGNLYARLALGFGLHDATGGYRAYRASVLEAIELETVSSQGYCFQVDLAWRAVQAGFVAAEVPITFAERQQGESKMSGGIVSEALVQVTRWSLAHRLAQLKQLLHVGQRL